MVNESSILPGRADPDRIGRSRDAVGPGGPERLYRWGTGEHAFHRLNPS